MYTLFVDKSVSYCRMSTTLTICVNGQWNLFPQQKAQVQA